jgi:hypothetical protein
MGIALLALVDLLSPLQSLANRWMPARGSGSDRPVGSRHAAMRTGRAMHPGAAADAGLTPACATAPVRPLRIVRTSDAQRRSGVTGRLVLSGRLADVCDELDRLAALEAAELSRSTGTLH